MAEQGIGLIIWDGFRPAAAQAKLWETCPNPTFVSHPVTGKRTHCRGNTVDTSLYDLETGEDLPVPTGYDNFTAYADRDYSDCSKDAAANARLLEQTMEKYGFTPYFAEWWHFADTTDYPIDEFFNPAIPTTWSANCNEYISLRTTPGGEVIAKITHYGTFIQGGCKVPWALRGGGGAALLSADNTPHRNPFIMVPVTLRNRSVTVPVDGDGISHIGAYTLKHRHFRHASSRFR